MAQQYKFEMAITAIVQVRAESESKSREIVSAVLSPPSAEDIRLANEANFVTGKPGTILSADFSIDEHFHQTHWEMSA
jgi:hypothetical protein